MLTSFYINIVRKFMAFMLCITSVFAPSAVVGNPVDPIADGADVRVVQFNIRCMGVGKKSIAYRGPLLVAQLNECKADSMGFQEANLRWMTYLQDNLEDYAYVGVARADGNVLGEFSPIFYLKEKYELVSSGTFWLSKTPDKPGSKDWGSNNIRICTWAVLKNKQTGESYAHFNTHLDHISEKARENQIEVLLSGIEKYASGLPVVVTGDFNDAPCSEMYNKISAKMKDCETCAPITEHKATFHNYGGLVLEEKIDYVFVSNSISPLVYHVIDDKINDDYLSDHYGIYVDLKL